MSDVDGREMMGDAEILSILFGQIDYLQAFADLLNGKSSEKFEDILEQLEDSKILKFDGEKMSLSQKGKMVVSLLVKKNALLQDEQGKMYVGKPVALTKDDLNF